MAHFLLLGAGLQGIAAAYDLIKNCGATELTWVDGDSDRLARAARRIRELTAFVPMRTAALRAEQADELRPLFAAADICVNCLPYRYSLAMTQLALEGRTHYLDLGGNTEIVRGQLALAAGHPNGSNLAILPDCGLEPGMGNVFAACAVARLGNCDSIHVRCGGLPEKPRPPLDYMLVFSVGGLTNEYFGKAHVLRAGKVEAIDTFTEVEPIQFEGLPPCEAFVTSGGLSTTPWSFAGKVRDLDYKTVRYRGHYEKFKLLLDLGLLDLEPVDVQGQQVVPRELLHTLLTARLTFPGERDLVVLRCTAVDAERRRELAFEIFERCDPATGFTAMQRTTAYGATACAHAVAAGKVRVGPYPLEQAIDGEWFLEALARRGIAVHQRERKL